MSLNISQNQQEKVSKGGMGVGMLKLEKQCQLSLQFCCSLWGHYSTSSGETLIET